jgi:hypothetical protein
VKTARLMARCSAQSREVWNALVRADGVVRRWSSTRLAQLAHRPLHVDEVHRMLGVMLVARNGALIESTKQIIDQQQAMNTESRTCNPCVQMCDS